MRKFTATLLIVVLGASCFGALIGQTLAQAPTDTNNTTSPPPLIVRWMRFRGNVSEWGTEPYHGSITVNAKTANVPPPLFKPWVGVNVVWSNEKRPIASGTKPVGEVTYTHYNARLVMLLSIRGKQDTMNLNVTGIWNVNKIKITSQFGEEGKLVKVVREITPIVTKAKGQLHITEDWKKFDIQIEGVDALKGVGIFMTTTTNMINPFSFGAGPTATVKDLFQVMTCFRAMPGFGNFNPELDYNQDGKIDLADLTTVAASM